MASDALREPQGLPKDLSKLSIGPGSDTPPLTQDLLTRRAQITNLATTGRFFEAYILEAAQLQILENLYGKEDKRAMDSLENLSSFCFELGQQEKGALFLDRVIAVRTKILGEAHPATLGAIASKVGALQVAGQMQQAERLGSELVTKCENALGVGDAATLRAMSNLASIYCSKKDYAKAEPLSELVLETRRRVLPSDDMDTIRAMVNLAGVYFGQQRWAEAALLLQSVLTVRRRIYGEEHEMAIKTVRLLEKAYEELERWHDILSLQQLLVGTTKKRLGEAHMETTTAKMKLMHTYSCLQAWETAAGIAEDITRTLKSASPLNKPLLFKMQEHTKALKSRSSFQDETRLALNSVYKPLVKARREIRLVNIKAALATSPIQCELIVTSLDDEVPYDALSYEWGPMREKKFLYLNGRKMNVTDNLWRALTQLRSTSIDRTLWVDAVCINQIDLQERKEQVQIMRDIYTKAEHTLVWLGEERDNSKLAMSFFKELENNPSTLEPMVRALQNGLKDPLWNAISCLFGQRGYWTRLWVVQEVICAKVASVHCGADIVKYEALCKFPDVIMEVYKEFDTEKALHHFGSWSRGIFGSGPANIGEPPVSGIINQKPLLELMIAHKTANCTDPRDKVYSLLGISLESKSSHPGLRIDYTKPVSEVYRGATQAIIEETGKLNIICMSYEPTTHPDTSRYHARHYGLPSWTPDWSTIAGSQSLSPIGSGAKASGDLRACAAFSPNGSRLTAEGICIAEIDDCTDPVPPRRIQLSDIVMTLLSWRSYVRKCSGISPGDPSHELFAPLSHLITLGTRGLTPGGKLVEEWWSSWEVEFPQSKRVTEIEITQSQRVYLMTILTCCSGRRMFSLDHSISMGRAKVVFDTLRLGLCPQETKQGDLPAAPLGCDFPVILRRQDDHYIFIGEVYVPAYMKGEAVQLEKGGQLARQKYEIH